MADELKARLSVDTSQFKAGMADAASSTRTLKDASAQLKVALDNLSQAESEFGAAAAAGNQQASAALAIYREEAKRAESAMAQLGATEQRETQTLRSSISARMAASAEMRIMEGNIQGSTRAAGALIASIPGLSNFAQALFPIFGIGALIGVGVQVGEALANAFDLGGERARALRHDVQDVNNELNRSITALDVQIDKLQQEQAKLEKRPFNGAKLVLDEAAEAAQNLAEKLDSVIQQEAKVISGMAASLPQKILLGGTGTKYEQTMLEEHTKWLNQAVSEQQQLNESVSFGNSLQTRLNDLKQRQADADSHYLAAANAGAYVAQLNYDNEINAVQKLMVRQQQEHLLIQKSIDLNKQQGETQHARDVHGAGALDDAAARARLQAMEVERAKEVEIGKTTLKDDHDFWAARIDQFKEKSEEYKTIQQKIAHDDEEGARQAHEAISKFSNKDNKYVSDESAVRSIEEMHNWLVLTYEDLTKTGERWHEYAVAQAKAAEIEAQNNEQLQLTRIAFEQAEGALTPLAAAEEVAGIHAEGYRLKLQALRGELERLQAEGANLLPGTPEFSKNQTQQAQVKNQILQVNGQQSVAGLQDTKAIQQAIEKPYLTAFKAIQTGWDKVQRDLILGTGNIQRDFVQMGANLVVQMAQNWEHMLANQIANEIKMSAAHKAALLAKQADDTTAAAISNATTEQSALKEIFIDAKTAAAGAYRAMAGIPVVGPELGAIAAGVTFAAVAALASFDVGTNFVPKTGVAMIHEGERIIPAADNRQLMSVLQGGGGVSRSSTSNVRATINNHYNNPGKPPSARQQAAAVRDLVRRGHV